MKVKSCSDRSESTRKQKSQKNSKINNNNNNNFVGTSYGLFLGSTCSRF